MNIIKTKIPDRKNSEINSQYFKELFDLYYEDLARFVFLITKNQDASEDIVQDFFTWFWLNRNRLEFNNSPKSYLFTSVKNRAYNFLRDNKKNTDLEAAADIKSADNFFESFESGEINSSVKKAINRLPDKCREIFILKRIEGFSYREISDKLGVSVKTVENQMGIALKKLRAELQPQLKYLLKFFVIFLTKYLGDS